MRTFWISWWQPTEDYRPVYDPSRESEPFNHNYWCSGSDGSGDWSMCALLKAKNKADAKARIKKYWPEADVFRFCDEKPDGWTPSDRFPMKGEVTS